MKAVACSIGLALISGLPLGGADIREHEHPDRIYLRAIQEKVDLIFTHRNAASPAKHMLETMGSGVGLLDFDRDSYVDVYLADGARHVSPGISGGSGRLFRNVGGKQFADVTPTSGIKTPDMYGMGVAVADYDNDGLQDLYLTGYPRNYLFRNTGDGHFQDQTQFAGVRADGWSTCAVFFDFDRDGLLDLYVCRYVKYNPRNEPYCGIKKEGWKTYCLPDVFDSASGILYHNVGDGKFKEITEEARVHAPYAKSLGVAVSDYDRDGWPDLFIANDRVRNLLFRNLGHGKFEEIAELAGVAYSDHGVARAGMGVDFADYDNDGRPDVLVTNFETEGAAIFRQISPARFEDVATRSEVYRRTYPFVGFGAKFVDLDNDGYRDIVITNGHVTDNIELYKDNSAYPQPKLVFRNKSGSGFSLVNGAIAGGKSSVARGAAFGDLDNDGRVDVIISNNGGSVELLRNESASDSHWLALDLVGRESNRDGIGARLELEAGALKQIHEVGGAGSYLSANDLRVYFGLADEEKVNKLVINWPSGHEQIIADLPAERCYQVIEGRAHKVLW